MGGEDCTTTCATLKPTVIRIHDCGDGAGIECVNAERIHDENNPVAARCFNKALKMQGACEGDGV